LNPEHPNLAIENVSRLVFHQRNTHEQASVPSQPRLEKTGTIEFGGSAISCIVRNMSDAGAMLDVATPVGIPDHFTLVLRADRHCMPCRVVWWKERQIGVVFE
jgi:hypothetical protein